MVNAAYWQLWCFWGRLSCVLLVLTGCGGSTGQDGLSTTEVSRLTIRIAVLEQPRDVLARRVTPPLLQTRQLSTASLRVEVRAGDIPIGAYLNT